MTDKVKKVRKPRKAYWRKKRDKLLEMINDAKHWTPEEIEGFKKQVKFLEEKHGKS